jgi:predicted double-glycine peptidase
MKANLIPAALAACGSFILFLKLYLRMAAPALRLCLIVCAFLLAIPAGMFASYYVFSIPAARWFIEMRALNGSEITSGLIGALLGIMFASSKLRSARLNMPILVFSTMIALVMFLLPFAKQVFLGVKYSDLGDEWIEEVCLQTSGYTCVPACAATVLLLQDVRFTERELARDAGTTRTGTEAWYLIRALRKRGYEPQYHKVKLLKQIPVPSIVGVRIGDMGHVIVLLEKDDDGVVVGEPLMGRRKYSWQRFKKRYRPTGTYITIHPLSDE